MHKLACEIIFCNSPAYDEMPQELRQRIADKVPPTIIQRGTKEILSFLDARPQAPRHYVLITA